MWLIKLFFSSILQTWYVELRISRSISESPLEFEITRVDCIYTPYESTGPRHENMLVSMHMWTAKGQVIVYIYVVLPGPTFRLKWWAWYTW